MKKVAIITMFGCENYGNRLQNYATQIILEKKGLNPISIKNNDRLNNKVKKIKFLKKLISFLIRNVLAKISNFFDKRYKSFEKFNENIKLTKFHKSIYNVGQYDYYIVGSDQVWKPTYGRLSDMDLLSFAPENKRIAFSASFGIDELPIEHIDRTKKELLKFKAISVREDAGKKIVENLTGRTDIEILIDPTMMLDSNDWDKVSKKPKMLKNQKYILTYFLGIISEERKNEIKKLAQNMEYEIINLMDKNSEFYNCGPSEFLYLHKNAELICTDSFHSSVFSIIYNKPFVVFEREDNRVNMNSRIETLLSKFKLEERKFVGELTNNILNHDYSEAYKILEEERKKSKEFLEKALDLK